MQTVSKAFKRDLVPNLMGMTMTILVR